MESKGGKGVTAAHIIVLALGIASVAGYSTYIFVWLMVSFGSYAIYEAIITKNRRSLIVTQLAVSVLALFIVLPFLLNLYKAKGTQGIPLALRVRELTIVAAKLRMWLIPEGFRVC